MRLIVTHEKPDFDALASLALAKLLYPGSTATIQGTLGPRLKAFLALYRDELDLTPRDEINTSAVTELIVVDTAEPTRIKPYDSLLGKVPVTLYDHHPAPTHAIKAARGLTEQLGAAASILTRELAATNTPIPPPIATLALLGIHEDTGNLTYDGVTPDDHAAAAYLLDNGANLELVRRYAHREITAEQLAFREALDKHAATRQLNGKRVITAAFEHPAYVTAASTIINDLLQQNGADAAIVAVTMDSSTLLFARSNEEFDVAATLQATIGGGGHPGAAFGKTDLPPEEALELVLHNLKEHASPTTTAATLMSSPVKTVKYDTPVAEAAAQLQLYGHNGMPVTDAEGQMVGVISRRDLDRATRHGMGATRVSSYMSRDPIHASPQATLDELERLILTHNIGRIPITRDGNLVGIVTRTDLINARHQRVTGDQASKLLGRLPSNAKAALDAAARLAGTTSLYLVGGTVRDLLIGAAIVDLDLVVEGDAPALAARVQRELGGTLAAHLEFGTATLTLPNGLEVDFASARQETYARPAALPDVVRSNIRQDLTRRDYSINALAIRLNPPPHQLIDPYGAQTDVRARKLRILHPLSFVEDPTRILRGARLAGRLGFSFESHTANLAKAALDPNVLTNLSSTRARAELQLMFAEPRVAPAIQALTDIGALQAIFGLGTLKGTEQRHHLIEQLDLLRKDATVPDDSYLLALLATVPDQAAERHVNSFHWPRKVLNSRSRALHVLRQLQQGATPTDDDLTDMDDAALYLLRAADPALRARLDHLQNDPPVKKLRGSDVVALGLPSGPRVGRVLRRVAEARAAGTVTDYEQELELARHLVSEEHALNEPEP